MKEQSNSQIENKQQNKVEINDSIKIYKAYYHYAEFEIPILSTNFSIQIFKDKEIQKDVNNVNIVFNNILRNNDMPAYTLDKLSGISFNFNDLCNTFAKVEKDVKNKRESVAKINYPHFDPEPIKEINKNKNILNIYRFSQIKSNIIKIDIDLFSEILNSINSSIKFKDKSENIENLIGIETSVIIESLNKLHAKIDQCMHSSSLSSNFIGYADRNKYISFLTNKCEDRRFYMLNKSNNIIFSVKTSIDSDYIRNAIEEIKNAISCNAYYENDKNYFSKKLISNYLEISTVKFSIFLLELLYENNIIEFHYVIDENGEEKKIKVSNQKSINKIIKFISENISEIGFKKNNDFQVKISDVPSSIYSMKEIEGSGSLSSSCMRPTSGSNCKFGSKVYDDLCKIVYIDNNRQKDESKVPTLLSYIDKHQNSGLIARALLWENVYAYYPTDNCYKLTTLVDRIYANELNINIIKKFAVSNQYCYKNSQSAGEERICLNNSSSTTNRFLKFISPEMLELIYNKWKECEYLPYLDTFRYIVLCKIDYITESEDSCEKYICYLRCANSMETNEIKSIILLHYPDIKQIKKITFHLCEDLCGTSVTNTSVLQKYINFFN